MMTVSLVLAALLLFVVWLAITLQRRFDAFEAIPLEGVKENLRWGLGATGLVLGHIKASTFHNFLREKADELDARMFKMRMVSSAPFVVVSDPELIEVVCKKSHTYGLSDAQRAGFQLGVGKTSIVANDGPVWKTHRAAVSPVFHRKFMHVYGELSVRKTLELMEGWKAGDTFNFFPPFKALALDILGEAVFGIDLGCVSGSATSLAAASETIVHMTGALAMFPVPGLYKFLHPLEWRAFEAAQAEVRTLAAQLLAHTRTPGARQDTLLAALASSSDLADSDIQDEIVTFLLGGFETTIATLLWCLKHLMENPEALRRVQEELDQVMEDPKGLAYEDLERLPVLKAALKESQRLMPAATGFGRGVKEDTELGGVTLPKGTMLMLNSFAVHHNPKYWPEPESFQLDRWLRKDWTPPRFTYMPFGAGVRRCIGVRFAEVELLSILAVLLRNYDIEFDASKPFSVGQEITYGIREMHIAVNPRK